MNGEYWRENIEYHKVDGETVGEFTGLQDCKVVDIYEDDLLSHEGTPRVFKQVVYKYGCFGFLDGDDFEAITRSCGMFDDISGNYEIIGNVHNNPDLLKGSR